MYCLVSRSLRDVHERAPVSHKQMRACERLYPVDRYLVESTKKFDIVNILDDETWHSEPALKPEDELVIRKLQDMLQSTADDLKQLSSELSKYHEPGIQLTTLPTPLDEEFNSKVHIEELVNAKFHGYKVVDKKQPKIPIKDVIKQLVEKEIFEPKLISTGVQVDAEVDRAHPTAILKKKGTSKNNETIEPKGELKTYEKTNPSHTVSYKELKFKYEEPEKDNSKSSLNLQEMPSINIRSALTEQKVVQLDILPQMDANKVQNNKNNVVIEIQHDAPVTAGGTHKHVHINTIDADIPRRSPIRRTTKMSTCDSESTSNQSDNKSLLASKKILRNTKQKNKQTKSKAFHKRYDVDEWRKKLNNIYEASTSRKKPKTNKCETDKRETNVPLNNEYIPYSKLTLGGVNVRDLEREIINTEYERDIPLSPIINKLLSRENSFNSPRDNKVLTTSDENLLQEVLNIEKCVSETISKASKNDKKPDDKNQLDNAEDNDIVSYDDDFEQDDNKDDTSDNNDMSKNQNTESDPENVELPADTNQVNDFDRTYIKQSNLSMKTQIDTFEFIHSIDTQDNATQIATTEKIYLKETQTSPIHSMQAPIRNDLWPTKDPHVEIEKLLTLEKDLIKKIILEEYGDLLSKPSTSKQDEITNNNCKSLAKNTQTSPARVKAAMTSPTPTKSRTTSPFVRSTRVNRDTSPLLIVTHDKSTSENEAAISINLSSPRFNLRLPQRSKAALRANEDTESADVETSSSDLRSLGEIKIHRRIRKYKSSISECDSSSDVSKSSAELGSIGRLHGRSQLGRSEGEVSLGQVNSEGEVSLHL